MVIAWAALAAIVVAVSWWAQDPPPKRGTYTSGSLIALLNSDAPVEREPADWSTMWIVLAVLTIAALGVLAGTLLWRGGERNGGEVSSH